MTREERNIRQIEANTRWREKNREFLRQYNREKYLKNRDRILNYYREKNLSKKPIKEPKPVMNEPTPPPPKREHKLFEILDVLRKDLRHPLWGKSVKEWRDIEWRQFNDLKNLTSS